MKAQKLGQLKKSKMTSLETEYVHFQSRNGSFGNSEQPIHLTEDHYKIIFENTAAAITVTDQNENLVLWNQLAANLLGIEHDQLYLKPIKNIYPAEEWKRIRSEHIRQKGIQHHMETKILGKAGRVIDIDLALSVLKGTDGRVQGSIGIMRDISERKRAERTLKENMELSRGMIETAATAIFLVEDGHFSFTNRILEKITGYSAEELKGMNRLDLIFPEYLSLARESIQNLSCDHSTEPHIFPILRKDLETVWVSEKLTRLTYLDKENIMGNWMDITEWKIAESIASEHSIQTEILLEIGNTVGKTLNSKEIADNVLEILSRRLHDGPMAFFLLPLRTEDMTLLTYRGFSEDFMRRINKVMLGKGIIGRVASTGKSLVLNTTSHDPRFAPTALQKIGLWSICAVPVFARGKVSGVICMGSIDKSKTYDKQTQLLELVTNQIGVAIDNAMLYEETSDMAFTDGLTGLYNRRYIEEGLKRELSRANRNRQPFSIISLDLDNLKTANDTFGHECGDRLLKEFGSILLKQTRKSDIAARMGGDEFMVLVTESDQNSASVIANRIWLETNSSQIEIDGEIIKLSVSGGVASFPSHGNTIEAIVKKSDEAMYRAKQTGKNQVLGAVP
jgi:diguanylate cyclase (GGDEF)-like protein/PAS domain S-box-containing protein